MGAATGAAIVTSLQRSGPASRRLPFVSFSLRPSAPPSRLLRAPSGQLRALRSPQSSVFLADYGEMQGADRLVLLALFLPLGFYTVGDVPWLPVMIGAGIALAFLEAYCEM